MASLWEQFSALRLSHSRNNQPKVDEDYVSVSGTQSPPSPDTLSNTGGYPPVRIPRSSSSDTDTSLNVVVNGEAYNPHQSTKLVVTNEIEDAVRAPVSDHVAKHDRDSADSVLSLSESVSQPSLSGTDAMTEDETSCTGALPQDEYLVCSPHEIEGLKQEVEKLKQELSITNAAIKEHEWRSGRDRELLDNMKKESEKLKFALDNARAVLASSKQSYSKLQEESRCTIEDFKAELNRLRQELSKTNDSLEEFRRQRDQGLVLLDDERRKSTELQRSLDEAQSTLKSTEQSYFASHIDTSREVEELKQNIELLKQELSGTDATIYEYSCRQERNEGELNEERENSAALQEKLEDIQSRLESSECQNDVFAEEISRLETANEDLRQTVEDTRHELTEAKAFLEQTIQRLEADRALLSEEARCLREDLENRQSAADQAYLELHEEKEDLETELGEAKQELTAIKESLEVYRRLHKQDEELLKEERKVSIELKRTFENVQSSLMVKYSNMQGEASAKADKTSRNNAKLSQDVERLSKEVERLGRYERYYKQFQEGEKERLERLLKEAQTTLNSTKQELADSEEQVQSLTEENDKLVRRIEKLQRSNQKLKAATERRDTY